MLFRSIVALDTVSPTQNAVSVVLPEQKLPVSELAGTWNVLSFERETAGGALKASTATFTLDAAGKFTAGSDCAGIGDCTAWTTMPGSVTASDSGGFTFTDTEGSLYHAYALKTVDGQVSLYILDPNTMGFSVAAPQRALALPALQSVNTFWDLTVASSGYAGAVTDTTTTVQSVDAATSTFTRVRTADGRLDGFSVNKPRDGLRYRAAGTSATTAGGTVNYAEIISMPLPGTGLSVNTSVNPNQSFFGISVNHD